MRKTEEHDGCLTVKKEALGPSETWAIAGQSTRHNKTYIFTRDQAAHPWNISTEYCTLIYKAINFKYIDEVTKSGNDKRLMK
jgi:hypothetical protein